MPRTAASLFKKILSSLTVQPPAAKNATGSTNNLLLLNFTNHSFCCSTNAEFFSLYYCSRPPSIPSLLTAALCKHTLSCLPIATNQLHTVLISATGVTNAKTYKEKKGKESLPGKQHRC